MTHCNYCNRPLISSRRKFCNDRCKNRYHRNGKQPKSTLACQVCKTPLDRKKKYCSNTCKQIAYRRRKTLKYLEAHAKARGARLIDIIDLPPDDTLDWINRFSDHAPD